MTEKEKMQSQKLYDANYDSELERERIECKALCQEYNHLPIKETEKRSRLIKKILGKTGEKIHIEPDFWCDYGYCISAGENFYANHGLVVLDAGGVSFGDNVFVAPNCGFHTSGHPIDFERRNRGLEYAYPIKVGNNVWFGAGVQVMPGVLCLLRTIFLETTYASCSGSTPASISNFVFLRIFGAFKASPSLSPTLPMKR